MIATRMIRTRFALFAAAATLSLSLASAQQPPQARGGGRGGARVPFRLEIPAFPDGGRLPDKYSCVAKMDALRPRIAWSGTPASAATLVFLMHDSDVHPGRAMYDNTHWIVWNIPANATEIAEGAPNGPVPEGTVVGKNTSGMPPGFARQASYAPPCAPAGNPHHYWFELFALDTKLDLPATATRAEVMQALDTHVVGKAVYTGLFSQPAAQ